MVSKIDTYMAKTNPHDYTSKNCLLNTTFQVLQKGTSYLTKLVIHNKMNNSLRVGSL